MYEWWRESLVLSKKHNIRLNFDIYTSEFRREGNNRMLLKLSSEDLAYNFIFSA